MTYKIACIYDISVTKPDGTTIGWAYWRRCSALQKWAPPDFEVDIFQFPDVPWSKLGRYALVYNTEYAAPSRKNIPAHVPLVVSFNSDSRRRQHFWPNVRKEASFVIFNNREAFDFYGRPRNSCWISNGVDTEVFRPVVPISERPHRLLWCGSSGPTKGKGYAEVFQPLEKLAPRYGFETDFRPINQITPEVVYGTEDQVAWYSSGSYILCASLSEGTPGFFTEGVACGCVGVSVPVGNVQEWGSDRENCVLCERSPQSFLKALEYAREHRERLSRCGTETIQSWSYGPPGNRAVWYFNLFRRLICDGAKSVKPFGFLECSPDEI